MKLLNKLISMFALKQGVSESNPVVENVPYRLPEDGGLVKRV